VTGQQHAAAAHQDRALASLRRPSRSEAVAVYLIYFAIVARTLTAASVPVLGWYLGLELLAIALFSFVMWAPRIPGWLLHLYFGVQVLLILTLLWLWPDFAVILFIPLCYQAALVLTGRVRIWWLTVLLLAMGVSFTYFRGVLGLAQALIPMAGGLLFALQVIFNRQLMADRAQTQAMIAELAAVNQQLKTYTLQVEELTALEERNRLARELHDSVSQRLFSITLNARAAQLLLEKDPARVRAQLERLQAQTQAALDEMRKFITGLRPKTG
jgi:signal transduction histidine kinase